MQMDMKRILMIACSVGLLVSGYQLLDAGSDPSRALEVSQGFAAEGNDAEEELSKVHQSRPDRAVVSIPEEASASDLDLSNPDIRRALTVIPPSEDGLGESLIRRGRIPKAAPPVIDDPNVEVVITMSGSSSESLVPESL